MTEQALPPYKAIGTVFIEIIGPREGASRWDETTWGSETARWAEFIWRNVTPQSMQMQVSWGADDAQGALTVPAAGSWQLDTYDPQRVLDPANPSSELRASIRPGRPIRVVVREGANELVIREGLIDEINFDVMTSVGSIRGTDGVELMVAADLPKGQDVDPSMPTTLRARARYLLQKAGLTNIIKVEPDPIDGDTGLPVDPAVGPLVSGSVSVWSHIGSSAFDALYAVWLDNVRTMHFRSFGDPRSNGLQIGGEGGIPLATLETQAALKAVYTKIVARDTTAPDVDVVAIDLDAAAIFGELVLIREKPVPNARVWADSVLADRSAASLQYFPGTLYPQTFDHLKALVEAGMVDIVNIVADDISPTINVSARLLGGYFRADTATGWTATILAYVPAKEWEEAEAPPEPEEPPVDPPPDTQQVTRTYNATKDTRAARTSGGANYGSGTEGELPVGAWQGWRNRAFIDFADIPWGDVVSVDKCILNLDTSSQVNVGFGSSPKVIVSRVTQSWSEGSLSSPGSGNSTVYPGPSATSSGQVTKSITRSENAAVSIDITAIARAWFGGSAQHGVRIISSGEDSTTYTTEFWSRENSTSSKRPSLSLTVTVRV